MTDETSVKSSDLPDIRSKGLKRREGRSHLLKHPVGETTKDLVP